MTPAALAAASRAGRCRGHGGLVRRARRGFVRAPCRGGLGMTGVVFWVLQLLVGQPVPVYDCVSRKEQPVLMIEYNGSYDSLSLPVAFLVPRRHLQTRRSHPAGLRRRLRASQGPPSRRPGACRKQHGQGYPQGGILLFVRSFPPLPDPGMIERRMRRLAAKATLAVRGQHLVSGVLLGQFAAAIGQLGAAQVYSLNLEYPYAKLKGRGLETCGKAPVDDFVRFESGSLEQVWWQVENDLAATFAAVRSGKALETAHIDRLRDLVALHHARSIQYYVAFEDNLQHASQEARRFWDRYPTALDAIAVSRLGLPGGDTGSRELAFRELRKRMDKWIEDGALFRAMMESRYRRTRHWFRSLGVEILTPSVGEFIIGDIPALAVRKGIPGAGVSNGIGYAHADAIILPIAPDRLLRVFDGPSRYGKAESEEVNELNAWQVRGAYSHVFFRPGSGLEEFIRSVDRPKPSEGVYREFYQLWQEIGQETRRKG